MTKSRRKRTHANKGRARRRVPPKQQLFEHPLDAIFAAIEAEDDLSVLLTRALWTFLRGPVPTYVQDGDEIAANLAVARGIEWCLFDLHLDAFAGSPASFIVDHMLTVPAARRDEFRGYAHAPVRFWTVEGRLDEAGGAQPWFRLRDLVSGARVHARLSDLLVEGDLLGAYGLQLRLFGPGDDDSEDDSDECAFEPGRLLVGRVFDTPRGHVLSPATTALPDASARLVKNNDEVPGKPGLRWQQADAVTIEELFGASLEWMLPAPGTPVATRLAEQLFDLVTDGAVPASFVAEELDAGVPVTFVAAHIVREIGVIHPQEALSVAAATMVLFTHRIALGLASGRLTPDEATAAMESVGADARAANPAHWSSDAALELLPEPSGPPFELPAAEIARLRVLPKADETWSGDVRLFPMAFEGSHGQREYPRLSMWVHEDSGMILDVHVFEPDTDEDQELWRLFEAMLSNGANVGRRPARVQFRRALTAARLAPALEALDIDVTVAYASPALAEAMGHFEEQMARDSRRGPRGRKGTRDRAPQPDDGDRLDTGGYLDVPGSTPGAVERLFDAAARYADYAPWRIVDDRAMLTFTSLGPRPSMTFGTILGNAGVTFGLGVYFDVDSAYDAHEGRRDHLSLADTLSLTFDPPGRVDRCVIDEVKRYGWRRPKNGWSVTAIRASPMHPPRLASGGEVELAADLFLAAMAFVEEHREALVRLMKAWDEGEEGVPEGLDLATEIDVSDGRRVRVELF
jgi:hypothetical protein